MNRYVGQLLAPAKDFGIHPRFYGPLSTEILVSKIISVLGREEGCTVKFSLSTREIVRAEPEGFPEGSGYIS